MTFQIPTFCRQIRQSAKSALDFLRVLLYHTGKKGAIGMQAFFETVGERISIIFLVILTFFSSFQGQLFPQETIYPTAEGETRVMSFNIRFNEFFQRRTLVPKLIKQYYPDSVGLQECTYQWMYTFRELLPEYGLVGIGRDTGTQEPDCGEMNAILYRLDKYELIDSGTFWLSETPDVPSKGWDANDNRICTWAVLEERETGRRYAHVNTHLDNIGETARGNGLALVIEKALSFDLPVVLTGDFNFVESTPFMQQLRDSGLIYTKEAATQETASGFTFHDYAPEKVFSQSPIDYIWVNGAVAEVRSYQIIRDKLNNRFVSDHYPIYSDLILEY